MKGLMMLLRYSREEQGVLLEGNKGNDKVNKGVMINKTTWNLINKSIE